MESLSQELLDHALSYVTIDHTVELHLNDNVDSDILAMKLARAMPNPRILDVTVANRRLRHKNMLIMWHS
jgi:hypothetical protein